MFVCINNAITDINQNNMTTIDKSCLITQLPIPEVISEIIKSFAFHSIQEITANNKVKNDKLVINLINHGMFSDEGEEHWTKELYIVEFGDNNEIIRNNSIFQMQSINCRVCGNYWHCDNISQIRCKCHENEELYDNTDGESDDEEYRSNRYYNDDDDYFDRYNGLW